VKVRRRGIQVKLAVVAIVSIAVAAPMTAHQAPPVPQNPLAPANLAKPRPKAPFDLTGTWFIDMAGSQNSWRFGPPPPANKMTPETLKHFEAAQKAAKEGKAYRDDIGQCWPAGLPLIMTRVWPIAMIQLPTAIYMVSHFMNSLRIVYLDGRPHSDPDIVVRTFNGESIGKWEGDTLVVDTIGFNDKFWFDFDGHPHTTQLRTTERFTRTDMNTLTWDITIVDPGAYQKPFTVQTRARLEPSWELMEYICQENNTNVPHIQGPAKVQQ
jgi:hypothetical protein